jgi:hypothetical protein
VTGDFSNNFEDNSRNTEAMEGKLEQSQSILGEQREGDKQTAIMKKQQQMTQYRNEKLAGNIYSLFAFFAPFPLSVSRRTSGGVTGDFSNNFECPFFFFAFSTCS